MPLSEDVAVTDSVWVEPAISSIDCGCCVIRGVAAWVCCGCGSGSIVSIACQIAVNVLFSVILLRFRAGCQPLKV